METFIDPFELPKLRTIEDYRKQFTPEELTELKRLGETIKVSYHKFAFGKGNLDKITSKVDYLFNQWIKGQKFYEIQSDVKDLPDRTVKCIMPSNSVDLLDQERKARENFPEFFQLYSPDNCIILRDNPHPQIGQILSFDAVGLFLTFITGLGVEIKVNSPNHITFDPDNSYQLTLTHKEYSGALSTRKNKTAYLIERDRQLRLEQGPDGEIRITTTDDGKDFNKLKPARPDCIDSDLVGLLASAVEHSYKYNVGEKIVVGMSNFAKALGVRFGKQGDQSDTNHVGDTSHFDFWEKMKQLENIDGVLVKEKKILPLFVYLGYSQDTNELIFSSPYLYAIMDILQNNPTAKSTKLKNNKEEWKIEGVSVLIDAKLIGGRSKPTSDLVRYTDMILHQRGTKRTDAKLRKKETAEGKAVVSDPKLFTIEKTYRELIKEIPSLKEIYTTSEAKRIRDLQRVFFGADYDQRSSDPEKRIPLLERYLRQYSDVFNYWEDLTIELQPLTAKTLDNKIIIRHHGANGDWVERLKAPRITPEDI